jgi:molybdenum cofactor synthesis domain-containing protein
MAPTPPSSPTAAVLLIGNELLSGKIQEANLLGLARELRGLGVRLRRVVIIEDGVESIADEVRALSSTHDWLFTSGGVGPTHDDVTFEGVAKAFGVPIERSDELASLLRAFYGDRCTEGHLRMADLPAGTTFCSDAEGDPNLIEVGGKRTPWPTILVRNVFVLPGIPQVFLMKLASIRAHLRRAHPGCAAFVTRAVLTDMDEGHLKPLLDDVVAKFPDIEVGSYPAWFGAPYRTKLTFDGRDPERVAAAADVFCATLPAGEPKGRE